MLTKNKKLYTVTIVFPFDDYYISTTRKIEDILGISDGSGAGFGERDLQYYNKTKTETKEMQKLVKNLKIKKLRFSTELEVPGEL